jgi:hypothetical protein
VLWVLTTAWLAACGRIGFGDGVSHDAGGLGAAPPGDAVVSTPGADAPAAPPIDAPGTSPSPDAAPPPAVSVTDDGVTMAATCGSSVVGHSITITNVGGQPLVLSNVKISAGFKIVSGKAATVMPSANAMFTVQPLPAQVGTDVGGTTRPGTLTMDTNDSNNLKLSVPLTANIIGANIQVTDIPNGDLATLTMVIPATDGACPAPQSFSFKITDTGSANVQLDAAGQLKFTGFTGGAISGNTQVTTLVTPTSGNDCTQTTTISIGPQSGFSGVCQTAAITVTYDFSGGSGSGSSVASPLVAPTCSCSS